MDLSNFFRTQSSQKTPSVWKNIFSEESCYVKRTFILSAATVAAVLSLPVAAQASTTQFVESNHGWVSYHHGPSLRSPMDGKLQLGSQALLVKQTNAWWYEIRINGKPEYVTTNTVYTHIVSVTIATPTPTPTSTSTSTPVLPAPVVPQWQTQADKLIATATTQLGVPYLWGHQSPGVGFDCSNFVAWSFRTALGIQFSGSSVYQRNHVGVPVPLTDIRPGDLLFFATAHDPSGGGHVGIYIGSGQIIQEGGGYGKVTISPLQRTWFGTHLVFARRVIN